MEKNFILFGAGQIGRMALKKLGNQVRFIIDNNKDIQGQKIDGIEIKSVESVLNEENYKVLITSKQVETMKIQLEKMGINNFEVYMKDENSYYSVDSLIFNPYEDNVRRNISETEWNMNNKNNLIRKEIYNQVEKLHIKQELFNHVEIETINRCNGNCEFCPVSKKNDIRPYIKMEESLFKSIINQLAEINYTGKLALFSNNEPFLDETIIEKHKYARKKLPYARMVLFTNGTLLNIEKFKIIVKNLDELIIDNYHEKLELINPCKEIVSYCEKHSELKKKVTIVLRNPKEILTSRGGNAPNRTDLISYGKDRCVLPYKQLIIRPDGKVSLCCNDALGKNTLGDLKKNTILEIWNNDKFKMVRECLYQGRENWKHCEWCDTFSLG